VRRKIQASNELWQKFPGAVGRVAIAATTKPKESSCDRRVMIALGDA
jgi:hypothetical protein